MASGNDWCGPDIAAVFGLTFWLFCARETELLKTGARLFLE